MPEGLLYSLIGLLKTCDHEQDPPLFLSLLSLEDRMAPASRHLEFSHPGLGLFLLLFACFSQQGQYSKQLHILSASPKGHKADRSSVQVRIEVPSLSSG